MFFEWTPAIAIGHPAIDADHRQLVDIVNQLHGAIVADTGRQIIGTVLSDLADYGNHHFRREEQYMRRIRYPGYLEHKLLHEALFDRLSSLILRFEQGEAEVTLETLEFLRHWLTSHIMTEDRKLADMIVCQRIRTYA